MAALTPGYIKTKVLIIVKTYPQPSIRHDEVVCTAGVTEDGEWVRLYPIDFRKLPKDRQFRKYQWIEVDLEPKGQAHDKRKESRRPRLDTLRTLGEPIPTKDKWQARRDIIDKLPTHTVEEYKKLYEDDGISLGIVKPERVLDVKIEPVNPEWTPTQMNLVNQLDLLSPTQEPLKKLPYKFSYVFKCEDHEKPHTSMIEDWELGALYLKEEKRLGSAEDAAQSVKKKYFEEFFSEKNDTRLFMGTTFPWNAWVVIGVFYPPRDDQTRFSF